MKHLFIAFLFFLSAAPNFAQEETQSIMLQQKDQVPPMQFTSEQAAQMFPWQQKAASKLQTAGALIVLGALLPVAGFGISQIDGFQNRNIEYIGLGLGVVSFTAAGFVFISAGDKLKGH